MSFILVCALHRCHVDCVSTFPVFRFFPIGSGVDVRNESVIKIDNIDDPYKYINEQVKASVSSLLSISDPDPSLNVLSLHQILYAYGSTVFCR